MTYIENFDCPIEQPAAYDVPCYEQPIPDQADEHDKPVSVNDPWDDVKPTLCSANLYLDYLYYADIKTDISTSASAEEKNQYLWSTR